MGCQWTSFYPFEPKPKSGSQNKASIQADKGDSRDTTCRTNMPKFPVVDAPGTCPSGCCTSSPGTSHIFYSHPYSDGDDQYFFLKPHMRLHKTWQHCMSFNNTEKKNCHIHNAGSCNSIYPSLMRNDLFLASMVLQDLP